MKRINFGRWIIIGIVVVVLLVIVLTSYAIVQPGHRGVVVNLGRTEDTVLNEGFHLVVPPMVRRVVPMDVRVKMLSSSAEAASSDLQVMTVVGVLNYHLDPEKVNVLYQSVGLNYEQIIIAPAMAEAIKAATAKYKVEDILRKRTELRELIRQTLEERLADNYIVVDDFSLADVTFSAEFDAAIERKQVAEQEALQKQYELQAAQKDVEIAVARADGERQAAIKRAEGRAESRRIEAEAEAAALALIAQQLRNNPDLIRYEWAVRLSPTISTVLLPSGQDIMLNTEGIVP
ncbi:MAG: prohibitin family protein [Chloroflexi bacterium]|nr:prohibitin family protein [Chloroflexota bacterium]